MILGTSGANNVRHENLWAPTIWRHEGVLPNHLRPQIFFVGVASLQIKYADDTTSFTRLKVISP